MARSAAAAGHTADDLSDLARSLDTLRAYLGLSHSDLADLIDRDRTTVWRTLTGKSVATPDFVSRTLGALGEHVHQLNMASPPVGALR